MAEHAKLSPSAAHRWLTCPGSLRFDVSESDETSPQAARGTELHAVAERVLTGDPNHTLSGEDAEIVDSYVQYIGNLLTELGPKADLLVEERVHFNEDIWGTADAVIISPYRLDIIDLKTGSGVKVSAYHNEQLMIYALAVLREFNVLPSRFHSDKPPQEVHLHIVQPPLDNYSHWEIKTRGPEMAELQKDMEWACRVIADDVDYYQPSEKACQWCKGRNKCKARAEFNYKLAVEDFALADPNTLTDEDLAFILPQVPQIVAWANRVHEYAAQQLLNGTTIKGYKLVQSQANRQWRDEEAVIAALVAEGLDESMVVKRKPIGIGAAEKLLGKSHEIFTELCTRPEPKPALAPDTDKRKAWLINDGSEFEGSLVD